MFTYYVRSDGTVRDAYDLTSVFTDWRGEEERWLFAAPHDDDIMIGGGLILQAGLRQGIDCTVMIASDGRMGYCTADQKDTISDIRRQETVTSFRRVGLTEDRIERLNFPDCELSRHVGRRFAADTDDPDTVVAGATGLENSITWYLRKIRPTRVFVPTQNDLHPDHKTLYTELTVSLFHANGQIWPELGEPLENVPSLYEMALYCPFYHPPQIKIEAADEIFRKKLDAIADYRSQLQIETLVDGVRAAGPVEYLLDTGFTFYTPSIYQDLFQL
jgi:LmbE family N-acetylglucosaminyl deacetylase